MNFSAWMNRPQELLQLLASDGQPATAAPSPLQTRPSNQLKDDAEWGCLCDEIVNRASRMGRGILQDRH